MKVIHIRKRFILVVLCTILLTILCAPIYSNHLVSGLYSSLYANNKARVSFYNRGGQNNSVKVADIKTSTPYKVEYPESCKNKDGQCAAIVITVTNKWQTFSGEIKVNGNGDFTVYLRGPYIKDDSGKLFPVLTDYRFATINEKQILGGRKAFENNKPYKYSFKAKDGMVIKFSLQVRKHHFSWRDLSEFYAFNYLLFLSVLILAFLFSYKLVQYISKFKILEHNSRIDIVFVITFLGLLFVPMSCISTAEKSLHENRMLAAYPKFFNNVLNLKYGRQFETWFSDRFFGRNLLINGFTTLQRLINDHYAVGKYRIYLDDWSLSNEQVDNKLSDKDKEQIVNGVQYLDKYCKEQGIKCYLMIVPRKLEFAKDKIFKVVKEPDRAQTLAEYLREKTDLNVVYPLAEMQKANLQDMVYYKTDHHWTPWGAYAGYLALMQKIRQDFPNIKSVSEEDYNISYSPLVVGDYNRGKWEGWSCRGLNLPKDNCPLDVNYKYYQHKQENALQSKRHNIDHDFHFDIAPNKEKVILLGNSFIENISYFMAYSFADVLKRRCNYKVSNLKLSRFKPEIEKEKTNILVVMIHSEYIGHLKELKD
ncbi:MAG: hypothetical protein IKN71_02865 [Alphaproteobacteria bacterium]|nr:hypothetical protein [Alphaproteobacteria bacterium]